MDYTPPKKIIKPLSGTSTLAERVAKKEADAQEVKGNCVVTDHAVVKDHAEITDNARIEGHARATEYACVGMGARVCDHAKLG